MMQQGYAAYRHASIDTADQGKLILIAYDVAIKHCKLALEKFDLGDKIEERTKHLFKAQDAVTELSSALRMDVGEIAHNLYRLYEYILRSLVDAGVKNNKGKIAEVLGYLENLRSAWDEAIKTLKSETAPTVEAGNVVMQG
ncbi:MAG: flagellar export chaperone FliS [Chitinispirillaceae bacterium]|nr:flagellar export chaperone FliS [Chitinispirillaceae bacterium]